MDFSTLCGILAALCAVLSIVDRVHSIEWLAAGLSLAAIGLIAFGGDVRVD